VRSGLEAQAAAQSGDTLAHAEQTVAAAIDQGLRRLDKALEVIG